MDLTEPPVPFEAIRQFAPLPPPPSVAAATATTAATTGGLSMPPVAAAATAMANGLAGTPPPLGACLTNQHHNHAAVLQQLQQQHQPNHELQQQQLQLLQQKQTLQEQLLQLQMQQQQLSQQQLLQQQFYQQQQFSQQQQQQPPPSAPLLLQHQHQQHRRNNSNGSNNGSMPPAGNYLIGNNNTNTNTDAGVSSSLSEEEDSEQEELGGGSSGGPTGENNGIELRGYLSKWTNYIYGWQPRYIVLKDGTLSYYKSEMESDFGCRGAISLRKATIKTHDSDELRFDVVVNNYNNWCLRAETPEDRMHWVEVLQCYKMDSANGQAAETASLRRHGSTMSLQSATVSVASGSSLRKTQRNLKEKVGEIETFKDILFGQIETLQRYFDACVDVHRDTAEPLDLGDGLKPIDFRGESITFRATTSGVLTTLQHCLEIIAESDETWKKKLDREVEKRKKVEEQNKEYKDEVERMKRISYPGPDLEEGPHSTLPEDEFFDAVETGLEKIEEDMQIRVKLKLQSQQSQTLVNVPHQAQPEGVASNEFEFGSGAEAKTHSLWPEIERVCKEQLHYAREGVGQSGNGWQIFADEGEIKMYKREEEVNGMVMDPLKAYHTVKGVTAREMCHYFFMPEFRNDWETTLEDCTILEKISADTLLFLQTHKRVWPATQRDALFWSHMHRIEDGLDEGAADTWIVCNNSTDYSKQESKNGKCVRIFLTVILACQTHLPPGKTKADPVKREDLTCKITYCSVVNPGGWAPASALRAVYKREYPKFLKRFTGYVIDQCKDKPIMF